ncbi:MAG: guanylate kinase, partial [Pseudomonadales bacterium]|nr:guanylate kinase [Pseudomonadales bacterium]
PSGAGKTSLVKALIESDPDICVSVSHTTRVQRPGEQHGVNYHFIDATEFSSMVAGDAFLEYATVFGNSYGTSKQWVAEQLGAGRDVILEIDWQGAQQVREWVDSQPGLASRGIFILPPSLDELKRRLTGRGQDEAGVIEQRMAQAVAEVGHYPDADFLVINDVFEQALADLQAIVRCHRLARERQGSVYAGLLASLTHA